MVDAVLGAERVVGTREDVRTEQRDDGTERPRRDRACGNGGGPTLPPGDLTDGDPAMLRLFDLEWRLDEVAQYAAWFAAPHTGTDSHRVALEGLLRELARPAWRRPG